MAIKRKSPLPSKQRTVRPYRPPTQPLPPAWPSREVRCPKCGSTAEGAVGPCCESKGPVLFHRIDLGDAQPELELNDPPADSPYALSAKAARNLEAVRKDLEASAQRTYESIKAIEVRRLAGLANAKPPIVVDVTPSETIKVRP